MSTNLKVILTAISIGVVASPVVAQSERPHAPASAASFSHARGSIAYGRATESAPRETNNHVSVNDCVRVAFPQCSGGN